jgi:hypothetical protein
MRVSQGRYVYLHTAVTRAPDVFACPVLQDRTNLPCTYKATPPCLCIHLCTVLSVCVYIYVTYRLSGNSLITNNMKRHAMLNVCFLECSAVVMYNFFLIISKT